MLNLLIGVQLSLAGIDLDVKPVIENLSWLSNCQIAQIGSEGLEALTKKHGFTKSYSL